MIKRTLNARYRNGCCSPRRPCPAHAMIAAKYRRRTPKVYLLGNERAEELDRLAAHRYGGDVLPDNDMGRRFVVVTSNHIAEPNRIRAYLNVAAPWYDDDDADDLIRRVARKRLRWNADTLASAKWLNVSYSERQALGLKTIGAYDIPKAERTKARRERYRDRQRANNRAYQERQRRAKGAKLRAQYEAESLSRTKPWLVAGFRCRRTWERHGKPMPESGASPWMTYTVYKRHPRTCDKPPSKRRAHGRARKNYSNNVVKMPAAATLRLISL